MYCSKCGVECPADAKYCHQCGASLRSDNVAALAEPKTCQERVPQPSPSIRTVLHTWRKVEKPIFRYAEKPSIDIEGAMGQSADLIFSDELIAIVAAPPLTALKRLTDRIAANTGGIAFGLGLVGGGLALLSGGLGEAVERLYGSSNQIDEASLRTLFETGLLIYGRKDEFSCRLFTLKKPIFFTYHKVLISGNFTHVNGHINLCLCLADDRDFHDEVVVRKGLTQAQCQIQDCGKVDIYTTGAILNKEFPWVYRGDYPTGEWVDATR